MKSKLFVSIILAGFLSGCATMKDSVLTGAATGAALGAGVGSASHPGNRGKGAGVGALVGLAVGAITGNIIHKKMEKRDDKTRKETLFNLDKFGVSGPQGGMSINGAHGLTMPKVESSWVPTAVKGKKLIEGHRVWLITETPQWVPAKENKKKK